MKEPLLNYWYMALASSHGIELACSDADSARAALYAIRREVKDPDLDKIATTISPFDPTRLWLRKKDPADVPT